MTQLRWLVGVLVILALVTIGLNHLAEQRNAALASDPPADLLKRIETLEARVGLLEVQLSHTRHSYLPPTVPKHWSQREFNGAPVYIVPLSDRAPKN